MKFTGFSRPESNYSKLPHELIGLLPIFKSLSELKVVLYVLRHTWGFQEFGIAKRITMDEFENGRKKADGSRIDAGTGMTRNSIKDGISRAIRDGFLVQEPDGRDEGRSSYVYLLNISLDTGSKVDPPPADRDRGSKVDPQGVKDLPPGNQELTPREAEIDSRSEKDTLEKNLVKKPEKVGADAPNPDSDPLAFLNEDPVEGYKRRVQEAMIRGARKHKDLQAEIRREFRISPNWDTKTARAFLLWLKERPAGQEIGIFAEWWWANDWRGKEGQPPTLNQIQELWPQAFDPKPPNSQPISSNNGWTSQENAIKNRRHLLPGETEEEYSERRHREMQDAPPA